MGRDILSVASYRQMKGRAGRKGKDTHGESFLCYSKNDEKSVVEMITGEMPEIASCLGRENKGFERALLEAVAANLATSQTAINTYASWTLFYHQAEYFLGIAQADNSDTENVRQIMKNAANYLIENGLVEAITEGFTQAGGGLKATILGKAIVSSALSIDEGLFVHRELDRSMRSFILDDELVNSPNICTDWQHLIYHCTPVYAQCEVDYKALRNKIDGLSESSILVATTIGVSPALINRLAQGAVLNDDTLENQEKLRIHRRFWISLMLQQLIKEEPLSKVAESFGVERGFLQSLCSTTTGFAGMVQVFCSKLGWGNLALLLGGFKERLMFGLSLTNFG
jgi:replicative superfamily II helicase